MRILIYGETAEAKELLEQEREAGHRASLRNPDLIRFDAKRPERCDRVITWSDIIADAYKGKAEVVRPDAKPIEGKAVSARPKRGK